MREGSYYSHHSVFFLEVSIRFIRFTSLCIVYRDGVDGVDLRHVINFFFSNKLLYTPCVCTKDAKPATKNIVKKLSVIDKMKRRKSHSEKNGKYVVIFEYECLCWGECGYVVFGWLCGGSLVVGLT